MLHGIIWLLLLLFWMILSENLKAQTLYIGIIISLLVTILNGNIMSSNIWLNLKKNIVLWLSYTILLIKEILVSNFNVAKIVLSPKIIISPQIVTIKTKIKSDFHKTIFANSITLTPGTLTISTDKEKIMVHCLKGEFATGLNNSVFEKIILKVEEDIYE